MNGWERQNLNARSIGLALVRLASDLSQQATEDFETEHFDIEAQPRIHEMERSPFHSQAERLVEILFSILSEDKWEPEKPAEEVPAQEAWSFGLVIEQTMPRQIYNGFLRPRCVSPWVENVPEIVVQFLITLPGGKDHLDREHHGPVGWHYHYLDMKQRRSDVILCWDTRWPGAKAFSPSAPRPLFFESHSVRTAKFTARPERWSDKKRESMYDACTPDLQKWSLPEFRCAANTAEAVWPRGSNLTARV